MYHECCTRAVAILSSSYPGGYGNWWVCIPDFVTEIGPYHVYISYRREGIKGPQLNDFLEFQKVVELGLYILERTTLYGATSRYVSSSCRVLMLKGWPMPGSNYVDSFQVLIHVCSCRFMSDSTPVELEPLNESWSHS